MKDKPFKLKPLVVALIAGSIGLGAGSTALAQETGFTTASVTANAAYPSKSALAEMKDAYLVTFANSKGVGKDEAEAMLAKPEVQTDLMLQNKNELKLDAIAVSFAKPEVVADALQQAAQIVAKYSNGVLTVSGPWTKRQLSSAPAMNHIIMPLFDNGAITKLNLSGFKPASTKANKNFTGDVAQIVSAVNASKSNVTNVSINADILHVMNNNQVAFKSQKITSLVLAGGVGSSSDAKFLAGEVAKMKGLTHLTLGFDNSGLKGFLDGLEAKDKKSIMLSVPNLTLNLGAYHWAKGKGGYHYKKYEAIGSVNIQGSNLTGSLHKGDSLSTSQQENVAKLVGHFGQIDNITMKMNSQSAIKDLAASLTDRSGVVLNLDTSTKGHKSILTLKSVELSQDGSVRNTVRILTSTGADASGAIALMKAGLDIHNAKLNLTSKNLEALGKAMTSQDGVTAIANGQLRQLNLGIGGTVSASSLANFSGDLKNQNSLKSLALAFKLPHKMSKRDAGDMVNFYKNMAGVLENNTGLDNLSIDAGNLPLPAIGSSDKKAMLLAVSKMLGYLATDRYGNPNIKITLDKNLYGLMKKVANNLQNYPALQPVFSAHNLKAFINNTSHFVAAAKSSKTTFQVTEEPKLKATAQAAPAIGMPKKAKLQEAVFDGGATSDKLPADEPVDPIGGPTTHKPSNVN